MAKQTVLVAEDNEALADLYDKYLRSQYDTKVAHSGKEALEKLDSSVDILVIDRHMRGYPGDDVLADARDTGWEGPVIFASGMTRDAAGDVSADDYLRKPIDKEELIEAVKAQL